MASELLVTSKDSNIRVIDRTSPYVGKNLVDFEAINLVDFEAIKRDLLSGENSSKILNDSPVVCTNTSVVQKHDVNTFSETKKSLT